MMRRKPKLETPDHSPESELALIGSLIQDIRSLPMAQEFIQPDDFFNPVYADVFKALLEASKRGDVVNPLTVHVTIKEKGIFPHAKERDIISFIESACDQIPGEGATEYSAKIVRRYSQKRKALAAAHELATLLDDGDFSVSDACELTAQSLQHIGSKVSTSKVRTGKLGTFGSRERRGLSTGFSWLDQMSSGGYPTNQMTVVAAYHKTGKSAWMIQSAVFAAQEGRRALYATFADMDGQELEERAMRNLTGYSRKPSTWNGEWEQYQSKLHPIEVYDASDLESGYDVETFLAWFESRHKRMNFTEVYVDYAQELTTRDQSIRSEYDRANRCASLIQRAAKRSGLPFIVGSQITEGKDGGKDITKGSRAWEEKAGWVLKLKKENLTATCNIAWSRIGPMGNQYTLNLKWSPDRLRFEL